MEILNINWKWEWKFFKDKIKEYWIGETKI